MSSMRRYVIHKKNPREVVSKLVRRLRMQSGLNQRDFADKIGVSQSEISRIESGAQDVRVGTLVRILGAFGGKLVVEMVDKDKET